MLSDLDKFLLSSTGANLLDGSNWGFCSVEDYEKFRKLVVKVDERLVSFYPLKAKSGVLVNVNSMYMFNVLRKINTLEVTHTDLDEANTSNMRGSLDFRLFLENNKEYQGFIGINEITDSINVTVSRILYPSFKVDFKEAMYHFSKINVEYLNEDNKWIPYEDGVSPEEFAKSFTVAPTRNCMVLPIRLR